MANTLYLIRHAEPTVQRGKKGSLTPIGNNQAITLAQRLSRDLSGQTSILVRHSPVARCLETAEIIAGYLGTKTAEAPLRLQNADNLTVPSVQSKLSHYLKHYKTFAVESPEAYTNRILGYLSRQEADIAVLIGNEVPLRLLLQRIVKKGYTSNIKHAECIKIANIDEEHPTQSRIE